ncbi:hypothetical protein [Mycobacterium colombiense]|nr:hypothetical protein [Mycobacterium colombiense]
MLLLIEVVLEPSGEGRVDQDRGQQGGADAERGEGEGEPAGEPAG